MFVDTRAFLEVYDWLPLNHYSCLLGSWSARDLACASNNTKNGCQFLCCRAEYRLYFQRSFFLGRVKGTLLAIRVRTAQFEAVPEHLTPVCRVSCLGCTICFTICNRKLSVRTLTGTAHNCKDMLDIAFHVSTCLLRYICLTICLFH